ncbi:MAG: RNA polymerase sigma factor [Sedimentisphaerales bacterium]|nr:RNA polymerase sigma factor [Sedimentisphaerales bacterium]
MFNEESVGALSVHELVRRAQQGDKACYGELVKRYWKKLFLFLRQKTNSMEDAEDLTQETFIKAYRNLHRYRESYAFSTWLYTIAIRLAYSQHRKNRASAALPDAVEDKQPNAVQKLIRNEQGSILWDNARKLPGYQYDVLWLRYAESLDMDEISRALGKSKIHVRVILHRARKGLSKLLDNVEDKTVDYRDEEDTESSRFSLKD